MKTTAMKTTRTPGLAAGVLAGLLLCTLAAPAGAQDKLQQCSNIRIEVDRQTSPGNWVTTVEVLRLQDQGDGWTTEADDPRDRRHVEASRGQSWRLNFGDGNHPVDVEASSGSGALSVSAGHRPSVVLVEVTGGPGTHRIDFRITGSPSPRARINGCPGGSVHFDVGR